MMKEFLENLCTLFPLLPLRKLMAFNAEARNLNHEFPQAFLKKSIFHACAPELLASEPRGKPGMVRR